MNSYFSGTFTQSTHTFAHLHNSSISLHKLKLAKRYFRWTNRNNAYVKFTCHFLSLKTKNKMNNEKTLKMENYHRQSFIHEGKQKLLRDKRLWTKKHNAATKIIIHYYFTVNAKVFREKMYLKNAKREEKKKWIMGVDARVNVGVDGEPGGRFVDRFDRTDELHAIGSSNVHPFILCIVDNISELFQFAAAAIFVAWTQCKWIHKTIVIAEQNYLLSHQNNTMEVN